LSTVVWKVNYNNYLNSEEIGNDHRAVNEVALYDGWGRTRNLYFFKTALACALDQWFVSGWSVLTSSLLLLDQCQRFHSDFAFSLFKLLTLLIFYIMFDYSFYLNFKNIFKFYYDLMHYKNYEIWIIINILNQMNS
jgi:hypothetical protein